jgi:hypothetical protein
MARSATVPMYFFHLHEDGSVLEDEEGRDLADDVAARLHAIRNARDVLVSAVMEGRLPLKDTIVVTNHRGQPVLSLALGDAWVSCPVSCHTQAASVILSAGSSSSRYAGSKSPTETS